MLPIHPYAEIFPAHTDGQLDGLRKDIADNGQLEPGKVYQNQLLDGVRRQAACEKEGIEFEYEEFVGTDAEALRYVISKNYHRRHLSDTERAFVSAKIAGMSHGGDRKSGKIKSSADDLISQSESSEMMNVSKTATERAKKILDDGTPSLLNAVNEKTISISDAAKVASEPAAVQDQAVADVSSGLAATATAAVKGDKKILCPQCAREVRVGNKPKKGCAECKKLNPGKPRTATTAKSPVETPSIREPGDEMEDAEGSIVPPHCIPAFEKAQELTAICREMDALIRKVEAISKGPGGRLIRFDSFKQQVKDAKGNLWANRCTHLCSYCEGTGKPRTENGKKTGKCEGCAGEGWTNKTVWHQAPGNNEKAKR